MTENKTEYEVVWPARPEGQNGQPRRGMVVPSGTGWSGRHGRRPNPRLRSEKRPGESRKSGGDKPPDD
jgi:hypothetical protein